MRTETFILRHSSMQHTDPLDQRAEDARTAFRPGPDGLPDAIGFTELGGSDVLVKQQAAVAGYRVLTMSSIGIAVHRQLEVLEVSRTEVLEGQGGLKHGNYAPRGVLAVTVRTLGGNIVTVHEQHWITDAPTARRAGKRREQSLAMVEQVEMHSRGGRVSFWMGDDNEDEGRREAEVQKPLTRAGLISIWDDLNWYPDTHGPKTIDVIGRYRKDRRVKARRAHVYPRRFSDHKLVEAVYSIKVPR